jgi:hypothetical protein
MNWIRHTVVGEIYMLEGRVVRGYKPGDASEIVELLDRVLTWPAFEINVPKTDFWKWKYLDVPGGPAIAGLVVDRKGIQCHSGGIPKGIVIGGKVYKCLEGVDLCQDREHSTMEMLIEAIKCKNKQAVERGIEAAFSFPLESIYETLIRDFEYRDLQIKTTRFVSVLEPRSFFRQTRRAFPKKIAYQLLTSGSKRAQERTKLMSDGYTVDIVNHFDPDVSDFFLQAAEDFDIVVVRNQEYLNWRYADMRAGAFSILLAKHSTKVAGYLVLKTEGEGETKACYIVDMLVSPEQSDVANLLLVEALQHASRSNAIALHSWMLRDHAYSSAFKEMGFVRLPARPQERKTRLAFRNICGLRDIDDVVSRNNLRVHMMLGDTDMV